MRKQNWRLSVPLVLWALLTAGWLAMINLLVPLVLHFIFYTPYWPYAYLQSSDDTYMFLFSWTFITVFLVALTILRFPLEQRLVSMVSWIMITIGLYSKAIIQSGTYWLGPSVFINDPRMTPAAKELLRLQLQGYQPPALIAWLALAVGLSAFMISLIFWGYGRSKGRKAILFGLSLSAVFVSLIAFEIIRGHNNWFDSDYLLNYYVMIPDKVLMLTYQLISTLPLVISLLAVIMSILSFDRIRGPLEKWSQKTSGKAVRNRSRNH